jgi:hypothetical protein
MPNTATERSSSIQRLNKQLEFLCSVFLQDGTKQEKTGLVHLLERWSKGQGISTDEVPERYSQLLDFDQRIVRLNADANALDKLRDDCIKRRDRLVLEIFGMSDPTAEPKTKLN